MGSLNAMIWHKKKIEIFLVWCCQTPFFFKLQTFHLFVLYLAQVFVNSEYLTNSTRISVVYVTVFAMVTFLLLTCLFV